LGHQHNREGIEKGEGSLACGLPTAIAMSSAAVVWLLSGERKWKNKNEVRVWVPAAWGIYSTQILLLAVRLRWTSEIG